MRAQRRVSCLAILALVAMASGCADKAPSESGSDAEDGSDSLDGDGSEAGADDAAADVPDDDAQVPDEDAPGPVDVAVDTADEDTEAEVLGDASVDEEVDEELDAADIAELDGSGEGPWVAPESHRILFVGNSYIYSNDLPSVYRTLALQAGVPAESLVVESVTAGGYRLTQHAADAINAAGATRLYRLLVEGPVPPPSWDVVVLQEQSQILGFPPGQPDHDASIVAGVALAGHADIADALTVLFMTWGYRIGDASNPGIYPDYLAMQARLESGYIELGEAIADAGHPVAIAPVGPSFRAVRQLDVDEGNDPLQAGNRFTALYSGDNSHPSAIGTYLAACVIVATTLGVDPTTLDGASPGVTDAKLRDDLQQIALEQVLAERERAAP